MEKRTRKIDEWKGRQMNGTTNHKTKTFAERNPQQNKKMNSTLKDERNPGQCLPRCRKQKSLKFKRWLSKDDQRPLWNT